MKLEKDDKKIRGYARLETIQTTKTLYSVSETHVNRKTAIVKRLMNQA